MILGIHKVANNRVIKFFIWMFVLNFAVMTFVFPFAGMRGGYLHSSAAFQPLLWAVVPEGLAVIFSWAHKKRKWDIEKVTRLYYPGIVFIAIIVTGFVFWNRIIGTNPESEGWNEAEANFKDEEAVIAESGALPTDIVMVNNPPGYFWVTGRSAIVTPDGDIQNLLLAADQFNAKYLILDKNHVSGVDKIFMQTQKSDYLSLIKIIDDNTQIYRIIHFQILYQQF